MKDKKGQSLIEFVAILPIVIIIIIYIIEFGSLMLKKYELESQMDVITNFYKEEKIEELNNYVRNNNLNISYTTQSNLITIEINKSIKTKLPLINKILGDNISTKRTIYSEQ